MLFRIHFLGGEEMPGAEGEDEDVVRLQDEGSGEQEPPLADEVNEFRRNVGTRRGAGRAPLRLECAE